MASPQFFAPERSKPSRPMRRFTLEQANKSLPLVRRIVTDIVAAHEEALRIQRTIESTPKNSQSQRAPLQDQMETQIDRLHDLVNELAAIGCEVKDYQTGLVDFTGRHQGRDVCLCWKMGEDSITHWHETSTGFAGRQPVSILIED